MVTSNTKIESQDQSGTLKSEPIFALDIGTRSVIGIVGVYENDILQVLDVEMAEHTQRAMIDGQIEDIDQVSNVVRTVKCTLEKRLGIELNKVHIAAAGRALKTVHASKDIELKKDTLISRQTIARLESDAILHAQEELFNQVQETENIEFYCVGYSVIKYYLDDYPISTLLNHKGKIAKVDIIATFLPVQVVDSLYLSMKMNNLQISSLTLEPIAAINAVIPPELRIINLALIDIGAGTSDIAISNDGAVVAYTMATVAGDEITEAIVKSQLVDFNVGEKIKAELAQDKERIEFENILGFQQDIPSIEILEQIKPAIVDLCSEITQKVLAINGQAPAAVFVVGGGSKMPLVCEGIAANLNIETNKVAVGSNNYMKRVVAGNQDIASPEFVTPVGIALTAALLLKNGMQVTVNGQEISILKNGNATVMDALQIAGFDSNLIMGRSGKSVTIEINEQKKIIRGGHPIPSEVYVNQVPASISTQILPGDEVTIIPCVHGKDADPTVEDVLGDISHFVVTLNDATMEAGRRIFINGQKCTSDEHIHNQDRVTYYDILTVEDLLKEAYIDSRQVQCLVNGVPAVASLRLKDGDNLRCFELSVKEDMISPIPGIQQNAQFVTKHQNVATPEIQAADIEKYDKVLHVTLNYKIIELLPKSDFTPYLFVDMLNYVDIDPSKPEGNIILNINSREASFLDRINDGDVIEIRWDKN